MAHYKRKRPRTTGGQKQYDKWKAKKFKGVGRYYWWMGNWPRWWDIVFHTRPNRRRASVVTRNVLLGKVDVDDASWPVSKKPHIYYW